MFVAIAGVYLKPTEKAINNVLAARGRYKSLSELDQDKAKMTVKEVTEHALPLLFKSNGIGELIENLNIFKTLWPLVYKANPQSADSIIPFILKTFEEDHSYWLQFQDTEVMARMAVLLCPAGSRKLSRRSRRYILGTTDRTADGGP